MLNFNPINPNNIMDIAKYFKYQNFRSCDYTICGVLMWVDYFSTKYAIYDNMLILKSVNENTISFSVPVGFGSLENALHEIKSYALVNKIPLHFNSVTKNGIEIIDKFYDKSFNYNLSRDWSDYLYLKEDIVSLIGRKFNGQRNHINKFKRLYVDYVYKVIGVTDIDRVLEFFYNYLKTIKVKNELCNIENEKVIEILENYYKLNLLGGFIELNSKIIAFSIGEIVNDTLFVHIEKALIEYSGSYSMINMEFAKNNVTEDIYYINREEDVGDIGLRTAKLAYHPIEILEKYDAIQRL